MVTTLHEAIFKNKLKSHIQHCLSWIFLFVVFIGQVGTLNYHGGFSRSYTVFCRRWGSKLKEVSKLPVFNVSVPLSKLSI